MRNLLISSEWEPQVSLPSNEKTCFPVALWKKWYLHARDLQLYCSDDSTQGDLTCRPQYIIVRYFTNSPESSITGALCFPHPYFVKPMFIKPDFFKKMKISLQQWHFTVCCQVSVNWVLCLPSGLQLGCFGYLTLRLWVVVCLFL